MFVTEVANAASIGTRPSDDNNRLNCVRRVLRFSHTTAHGRHTRTITARGRGPAHATERGCVATRMRQCIEAKKDFLG